MQHAHKILLLRGLPHLDDVSMKARQKMKKEACAKHDERANLHRGGAHLHDDFRAQRGPPQRRRGAQSEARGETDQGPVVPDVEPQFARLGARPEGGKVARELAEHHAWKRREDGMGRA